MLLPSVTAACGPLPLPRQVSAGVPALLQPPSPPDGCLLRQLSRLELLCHTPASNCSMEEMQPCMRGDACGPCQADLLCHNAPPHANRQALAWCEA